MAKPGLEPSSLAHIFNPLNHTDLGNFLPIPWAVKYSVK